MDKHLDPVLFDGLNLGFAVDFHGLRLLLRHVKHGRNTGPVNVRVDEPDLVAKLGECDGEVGRNRAFAHAAFAGGHGDDVLDAWQHLAGFEGALLLFERDHVHLGRHGLAEGALQGELHRFLHAFPGVHGGVA